MKKIMYVLALSVAILGGCSQEQDSSVVASAVAKPDIPTYYEDYTLNPQVTDDRTLQELGQSKRDSKGEVVAKAVNMQQESYDVDAIKLTVAESKVLQVKPDYSLIDFFHVYTHEAEFEVVKLFVEITNTSDKPLNFGPVALLETDTGEVKLWEDDVYLEDLNGELAAGETKKGNVGFIVEKGNFDAMTITTSDVFDTNGEQLAKAIEFTTQFD